MAGKIDAFVAGKARCRFARGDERLDDAVAHRDGMMLEHRARRLDRHYPAGAKKEGLRGACPRYLGVPWISTTTLRLGARHSISALRCFASGQAFTGKVLPKPKTSIFAGSAPLAIR